MDWGRRLDAMVTGYRDAMILVHANKTGILEELAAGGRSAAAVAAACDLDLRATDIVLCALAAAGVLRKHDEIFELEPGARPYLLADGEQTMTSIIGHNLSLMQTWVRLDEVLSSGEPVPRGERSAEQLRDFICGMENVSRQSSREVADKIDFSSCGRLLDLGGGPATAAIVLCRANPQLHCEVFDLPAPAAIGAEQIDAAQLSNRITVRVGDFLLDELGEGFDVVYVSNIVHSLGTDEVQLVLAKCHRALVPGGRVMIKDFFLEDDGITPAWAAQFAVNMLVNSHRGKSYPRSEMHDLLHRAGFTPFQDVQIGSHSQVLIARRES